MRKLVYVMPIVWTLLIAADMVTTIILFSFVGPQSGIVLAEKNPLGYPLCLINILVYSIPCFVGAYGISRVKRETLFWVLTAMLIGFLIPFCVKTLAAVTNNVGIYTQLTQNIELSNQTVRR